MFEFLKEKFKKISSIFFGKKIDESFIEELKTLLIQADTGIHTTNTILENLKTAIKKENLTESSAVKEIFKNQLVKILNVEKPINSTPTILLLVGINGSGKTTFAAKLANSFKLKGKKVLLVAADTFRAAAVEQLQRWGEKISVEVFSAKENQDPSSVIFDACKKFKDGNYDHLIIDTAGRVQTKVNLMKELTKMKKTIDKQLPSIDVQSWLTVDAMLGQNSFEQAKTFKEATDLDGIVLTKLDGTGKGGIVFSITDQLSLPIIYFTFGEGLNEINTFNSQKYVEELLS